MASSPHYGSFHGNRILDIECGLGWFARWAVKNGAPHIDARDISSKMMKKATQMTAASMIEKINYQVKDVSEGLALEEGSYDLIYSNLALHYLETPAFTRLVALFHAGLKLGGRLVFSVEHPIYTAPTHGDIIVADVPPEHISGDGYGYEGLRETTWFGGDVRKYHRTMTTYVQSLLDAGFKINGFREYMATEEDLAKEPQWKGSLERPIFLLVKAEKKAG